MTTFAYGQIDYDLRRHFWKPGKERIILGNPILRLEGRNTLGGMVNAGYEKYTQVKTRIEKKADTEMWTPEMKNERLESLEKFCGGGMIHLYITRLTIDAANAEMFTIIVKDSTDTNEIFRKELERNVPEVPPRANDYWWNYITTPIPEKINGKIYIYIIDKLGMDNNKFKFEVNL